MPQQQWQSGEVDANGIRVHYTRTGGGEAGKPALVLAHGFSDDGLCWTAVARELESGYDVIMVDARGHGRTEAPEGVGYGAVEQAADLAAVIAALGLKRPLILGHSMGAMTALALAGTYPAIPRAILLEDPPAPWMPQSPPQEKPSAPAPASPARPAWLAGMDGKTREELIEQQRVSTPQWSDEELGPWADSKIYFLPKIDKRGPGAPLDWLATLHNITCPVLLITGESDRGGIITPEKAAALQALVPQTQVEHIAGAGHSIRRDKFAPFMQVVRDFLSTVTAKTE